MTKRWMLKGLGLVIALATPLSLMAQDAAKTPAEKPAKAAAPAATPATPVDPAVLLKAIPADATAFLAITNLKQLDQDVQASSTALGLPPNTVPSLSGFLKDSLRLGEGFNENGSVAVVVLNASKVTQAEELEKQLVLLFPASNPKGLATAMGGKEEEGVIKLDLAGAPAFAAPRGDFLAVAKDQAALKALEEAKGDGLLKTLPPERQKAMTGQDVFGWVNLPTIPKDLRDTLRAEIEKAVGSGPQMKLMEGNLEQLNSFLEQGQELAFGISLDAKRGITINFLTTMKPDSEMGKQMAAVKPASGSLLVGLPADPFVIAGGTVTNPESQRQVKRLFDTIMSDESVGEKVDKDKLGQIRDGLVRLLSDLEQVAFGVYGLPADGGQGLINVTLVARVKDSAAWKQDAKKLFTVGKDLAVDAAKKEGEPEETVKQVADAVQWKENAEKVGGADVDQLVVDLSKMPETSAEEVDQAKKVLGPEGVTVRIGAIGKDKVAVVFGGGTKRFESIAKLAAAGESPLSGNSSIKSVADRLPKGPKIGEGFFNVDKLVSMIQEISNEVGGGMMLPINLQNAAPLALTGTKVGENGTQVELLIPMEFAKSVADVVRPMLMMGLGGGGGSQPGDSDEAEPPADNSELK